MNEFRLTPDPRPLPPRCGITLIEILISMFVLLFGLMGVAAIFPVASHYVVEGEKRDRGSGLAQIAFEEIKARNLLQPKTWAIPLAAGGFGMPFISVSATPPNSFSVAGNQGHAFILDPLSVAAIPPNSTEFNFDSFPINALNGQNPWWNLPAPQVALSGNGWPTRRLSLDTDANPDTATMMQGEPAETTFRLRDDLAVEQPDAGDRPSIQRWSRNDNGTPNILTDDQLLARQFQGDYSWMATVVPASQRALLGLQPAANIKDAWYEVSAVVFYKRDTTPSATVTGSPGSERLIAAEFLNSAELVVYDANTNDDETVDTAFDKIKPGNWVAVMGVNQVTGTFMMKWYKILALDEETDFLTDPGYTNVEGRYLMVQGPDWPTSSYQNLRVAVLPGVIDVYTRPMHVDVE